MDTSIDIVYAEVYEILKGISKEKVALIPKDIILKIKGTCINKIQVLFLIWTICLNYFR